MLSHRSAFSCTIAIGALCIFSGISRAAPSSQLERAPTRVVRFGDLDLGTSRGVKALYVRIRTAAQAVCGEYERPDSLVPSAAFEQCVRTAIESAVAQVNVPALAAYYQNRRTVRPLLTIATR
jgi:UrcA family protein